jgi:hypothetical protein
MSKHTLLTVAKYLFIAFITMAIAVVAAYVLTAWVVIEIINQLVNLFK